MNAITAEARQALRAALADPFAGMTEQELDRIARGQPLPPKGRATTATSARATPARTATACCSKRW